MHLLFRRHRCPIEDEAVKTLFRDNLSAHERATAATEEVTRVTENSRQGLEAVREDIARRTAAVSRSRPHPRTSDVRAVIEEVLNSPKLRGEPNEDRS